MKDAVVDALFFVAFAVFAVLHGAGVYEVPVGKEWLLALVSLGYLIRALDGLISRLDKKLDAVRRDRGVA